MISRLQIFNFPPDFLRFGALGVGPGAHACPHVRVWHMNRDYSYCVTSELTDLKRFDTGKTAILETFVGLISQTWCNTFNAGNGGRHWLDPVPRTSRSPTFSWPCYRRGLSGGGEHRCWQRNVDSVLCFTSPCGGHARRQQLLFLADSSSGSQLELPSHAFELPKCRYPAMLDIKKKPLQKEWSLFPLAP